MRISNPRQLTAEDLLPRLQERYPQAAIRKPLFSKGIIVVPMQKWKLFLRPSRNQFIVGAVPPMAWTLIGNFGAAFVVAFLFGRLRRGLPAMDNKAIPLFVAVSYAIILLAFAGVRAVWKIRQRETIERFRQDAEQAAANKNAAP